MEPLPEWCRFQITDGRTQIMQGAFFGVLILLMIIIIHSAFRSYQHSTFRYKLTIYVFLFLWIFCFMVKIVVGIVAYEVFMDESIQLQESQIQTLRILSAIFEALDGLTTFFLMTLMIQIPYLWIKNILDKLKETSLSLTANDRLFIHQSYKVLGYLKIYICIRNIILLFLGTSSLVAFGDDFLCNLEMYFSFLPFILQSIILIFTYAFGYYSLRRLSRFLPVKQQTLRKITNQYMALSVSCIARIAFILILSFAKPEDFYYIPDQNCHSTTKKEIMYESVNDRFKVVMLPIAYLLCHVIPVLIIVYIYSESPGNKFRRQSQLDNSSFDYSQYQNTS